MQQLQNFFKAIDLISVNGIFDMGLIIKKKKIKIDFSSIIDKSAFIMSNDINYQEKLKGAIENNKWAIIEIDVNMSSLLYSQLKLLSKNNRMQIIHKNETIDIKQGDKSRIIVLCNDKSIKKIDKEYPDFRNLFGPILTI